MISSLQGFKEVESYYIKKTKQWKQKCVRLSHQLGISPSSSASLLIDDENDPSGINTIKCIDANQKVIRNQEMIISEYYLESDCLQTCKILQVYRARTTQSDIYSNQNEVILQWRFQQVVDLKNTKYNLVNHLEIKSIIENTPPIAYRHQQLIQQYCFVAELHRVSRKPVKYYLSVIVNYRLRGQYFLPEINCFLSEEEPNIHQMLLQIQLSSKINIERIFSKLDVSHHLDSLYVFFKQTCGMSFIDDLMLELMLEKSILVKGKSNKYVSQFIYLLTHYTNTPLCHSISYQIMDPQLLELPAPFIFGSSEPSVLRSQSSSVFIIDLDNCTFKNIPMVNRGFKVRQFVAHLFHFVQLISGEMDQFEVIKAVDVHFRKDSLGLYMFEYVKTMGFHQIQQGR